MITGAATSPTLHESRLKIIFRSVESDSESSSEVTKLRLHISDTFWNCFQTISKKSKSFKKFQKVSKNHDFTLKKCNFPGHTPMLSISMVKLCDYRLDQVCFNHSEQCQHNQLETQSQKAHKDYHLNWMNAPPKRPVTQWLGRQDLLGKSQQILWKCRLDQLICTAQSAVKSTLQNDSDHTSPVHLLHLTKNRWLAFAWLTLTVSWTHPEPEFEQDHDFLKLEPCWRFSPLFTRTPTSSATT